MNASAPSAHLLHLVIVPVALLALDSAAQTQPADPAEALYAERCAKCHDGGVERAPSRAALRLLPYGQIRKALIDGSMKQAGKDLASTQIDALAKYLGAETTASIAPASRCPMPANAFANALGRPHWDGWGNGLAQHRYQPAAMARLAPEDVPKLKLKWAFGFPGVVRVQSQAVVVAGRLFIGSTDGTVYALDAGTGCVHWTYAARFGVRTAISAAEDAKGWSLYFGDLAANVHRVDAKTGQMIWITKIDQHAVARVTGAPSLNEGVLYAPVSSIEEATSMDSKYGCCTFRGSVVALDAQTGKILWKSHTIAEEPAPTRKTADDVQQFGPAGGSVWSSPTVDPVKRRVYVTTGNRYADPPADGGNAIVAFGLKSGERIWVQQKTPDDAYTMACGSQPAGSGNCPSPKGPDVDFGSSAILVQLPGGKRALIAGQKSGTVHAIDPDRDGAPLWKVQIGVGSTLGGVQWGSATDERRVYVALSDVKLEVVPAESAGAQPFGPVHLRYDPERGGGLGALDLATGNVVWKTPHPGCEQRPGCSPAQSAAVTAIPGIVFSGGLDGHLRAYAADTGRIVWDVDTVGPYRTVNGVPGQGGSLDGPGPIVVDGTLYVGSGYALFGGMPGNVLLAYTVDGK